MGQFYFVDLTIKVGQFYVTVDIKGVSTKKQMRQAVWEIEGDAFGAEYYAKAGVRVYFRVNDNVRKDLLQVRIATGLNNKDARKYLISMAYFIDSVFCHIEYPTDWCFTEADEKFLCPRLFKRYFAMTKQ